MKVIFRTMILITLFSVAMGFLESAVVVYLRELYYPNGFNFPLAPTSHLVLVTELGRELATLVMLLCIGYMNGKNLTQRFVFFLYSFAIWDLFYYVFLKILINWPESMFTWDILFLLPFPWVGPVLAPCILSFTMIVLALMVIYGEERGYFIRFNGWDWALMILASLILIFSFTQEYISRLFSLSGSYDSVQMLNYMEHYVPASYNWLLFIVGEVLLIGDIIWFYRRIPSNLSIRNEKSLR